MGDTVTRDEAARRDQPAATRWPHLDEDIHATLTDWRDAICRAGRSMAEMRDRIRELEARADRLGAWLRRIDGVVVEHASEAEKLRARVAELEGQVEPMRAVLLALADGCDEASGGVNGFEESSAIGDALEGALWPDGDKLTWDDIAAALRKLAGVAS